MRMAKRNFVAEPRPWIARNRDVIHFRELHAGLVEAILNRARRQSRRVFHAIQAFFFYRRKQAPVGDDRRRSVRVISIDSKNDHCEKSVVSLIACGSGDGNGGILSRLGISGKLSAQMSLHPFIEHIQAPWPRPRRSTRQEIGPNPPRIFAAEQRLESRRPIAQPRRDSSRAARLASNFPMET